MNLKDFPGEMKYISKYDINIDNSYQRPPSESMIKLIVSEWSWGMFGTLKLSQRITDGKLYVFDGQHRLLASRQRPDINQIPCVVYELTKEQEAELFAEQSRNQRPVKPLERFKADLEAKDEIALFMKQVFDAYGITPSSNKSKNSIKSIAICRYIALVDQKRFRDVIELLSQICKDNPIDERMLQGINYLSKNLDTKITDQKLRQKILNHTLEELDAGAEGAYINNKRYGYGRSSSHAYAEGILGVINKGLRNRYRFREKIVE